MPEVILRREASVDRPPNRQVVGACPHDCPDTCSLLTTVQDGKAVKVQGNPHHPQTDGVLCTKVARYTERTYHPQRLLQPLKRSGPKGSGQFTPVSWESAIADICARLKTIIADPAQGPQAVLPYSYAGTMGWVQSEGMAARFFNRMGASLLDYTICASAGGAGLAHTLGANVGMAVEQFANAKLILIWGSNPITSSVHFWRYAQEAKRKGARLVCIDPRRSETAEKCHSHIALLPGTDAALALALMHELIVHDWLDHDYLARYTVGWEALRARALQWPPSRAAQVCGISPHEIEALARNYGQTCQSGQPAAIRLNYGMQRSRGAANAVRAVTCLPALTGAWRHAAGGMLLSSSGTRSFNKTVLQHPELRQPGPVRTINMSTIGDDLLRPPSAQFGPAISAVFIYNSNPVAVAPDSSKVVQGFAREDLFTVVLEHFQTDTADYADYLLPATTQLEHWDIHTTYGHTDLLLNEPAIAPLGQARSNAAIFRALAHGMDYAAPCFTEDDLAMCKSALAGRLDFEALAREGYATLQRADAPFAQGNFPTPSGRCELWSERLASAGLDGLPDYLPNYEAAGSATDYPLAMISPPARNFMNSTFVNVQSLSDMENEPLIEIHPQDAQLRNIADGALVRVFNGRGHYHCVANVSERARPGVVIGLGVWWRKLGRRGTNVNELTHQKLTDLGRAPTFYDCAVQVENAPVD
jgi:anaerobic selenocysteine-containing dehydrogenase